MTNNPRTVWTMARRHPYPLFISPDKGTEITTAKILNFKRAAKKLAITVFSWPLSTVFLCSFDLGRVWYPCRFRAVPTTHRVVAPYALVPRNFATN